MEWLGDNQWVVWLAASLGLGVIELLSLDLIFLMLAVGAIAGMVTSLFAPFLVAALVAGGVSLGCLAVLRPSLRRRLHAGPDLKVGPQRLAGRQALAEGDLSATRPGRVTLDGVPWAAVPFDDTLTIDAGETVEVLEIRGSTAYVHVVPTLGR